MSGEIDGLNRSALALKGALELWRDDPSRWYQGGFAADNDGDVVCSTDGRASAWCAMGAVEAFAAIKLPQELEDNWVDEHMDAMLGIRWQDDAATIWNDAPERTFDEVQARFTAYFGLCAVQGG